MFFHTLSPLSLSLSPPPLSFSLSLLRYFNTFLNLVHSMNSVETSKLGQLRRATITRQVSALREATILAMSNMLTSNIDSGLTHAISMKLKPFTLVVSPVSLRSWVSQRFEDPYQFY